MSMILTAKALNMKVGNPLRKLVLVKLADNANDEGICFPSVKYIADVCEISETSVKDHIKALISMGLVTKKARKTDKGNTSNLYILHLDQPIQQGGTNADVGRQMPKGGSGADLGGGSGADYRTNHSFKPINEPSTLQPPAATRRRTPKFSDDDLKTAHWIFDLLKKLNPNIKTPNFDTWANEVRLLREVDNRSHREICELFQWANRDPFWQANILSPRKLREKWDQLAMKKSSTANSGRSAVTGTGNWNTAEGWREVI